MGLLTRGIKRIRIKTDKREAGNCKNLNLQGLVPM